MSQIKAETNIPFGIQVEDYKYIRLTDCYLSISDEGVAEIMASAYTVNGTEWIDIEISLQKLDSTWGTIKKWENNVRGRYAAFFATEKINKKEKYRIEVIYNAHKGHNSEILVSFNEG